MRSNGNFFLWCTETVLVQIFTFIFKKLNVCSFYSLTNSSQKESQIQLESQRFSNNETNKISNICAIVRIVMTQNGSLLTITITKNSTVIISDTTRDKGDCSSKESSNSWYYNRRAENTGKAIQAQTNGRLIRVNDLKILFRKSSDNRSNLLS